MEIFSEIYSCYYKTAARILKAALEEPLSKSDISKIIESNAFSESAFYMLPKLLQGDWNLLKASKDKYSSVLGNNTKMPLTLLEKAWLKAILNDKRINLFLDIEEVDFLKNYLGDIEPLFNIDDFHFYDTFLDGDNYESPDYKNNFREVLKAVKNKTIISISFFSSKSGCIAGDFFPLKIEYSSKDDKFRLHTYRIRYGKIINLSTINLSSISRIMPSSEVFASPHKEINSKDNVIIEISKERNAVERCMLHFANFEKHTEYDETTDKYICSINYNKQDETELLIRILSFGPVIKVLAPEKFLNLIKERVMKQTKFLETINI